MIGPVVLLLGARRADEVLARGAGLPDPAFSCSRVRFDSGAICRRS